MIEHLIFVACQILQLDLPVSEDCYAREVLYFDLWWFILAEYGSDSGKA